jgi:hypothetical protein
MSEDHETGPLGQCVYTMSTGRRCQKDAEVVLKYGSVFDPDPPAYGYCVSHELAVTKPRDPRIHKTAEPLIRVESQTTPKEAAA